MRTMFETMIGWIVLGIIALVIVGLILWAVSIYNRSSA